MIKTLIFICFSLFAKSVDQEQAVITVEKAEQPPNITGGI